MKVVRMGMRVENDGNENEDLRHENHEAQSTKGEGQRLNKTLMIL